MNTIRAQVQGKLKEFQENQKDDMKKKYACIKKKEAEKLAIQKELGTACKMILAES